MSDEFMDGQDAAYASDISSAFTGIVSGYFGGPNAYHIWTPQDWLRFRHNPKLPIWVAGYDGEGEAKAALPILGGLGVPRGSAIGLDMEQRVDETYLMKFAAIAQEFFKLLVYGSASTVFGNPQLNGYWVADWTLSKHMAVNPATGSSLGVRGTQYADGPLFDNSVWKPWVTRELWT